MDEVVPLLLLCGAPGAGKSSIGWEVYSRLVQEGVRVAHIDLDGIGYGPPGLCGSFEMKFENVAALWRNYSKAGASCLVVSGLRVLKGDARACTAAIPGAVPTPLVLTVTPSEQRERILTRANTRYAVERGGGSSGQTPEGLERFVSAARQQLEEQVDEIPGALVNRHRWARSSRDSKSGATCYSMA
jgi:hypothetical protein